MTTENRIYTELANLVRSKIRNNQPYFSGSVSCENYEFMCSINTMFSCHNIIF